MDPTVRAFLDSLNTASSSPPAFVAYVLVLASWVVTTYLKSNLKRMSQQTASKPEADATVLRLAEQDFAHKKRILLLTAWAITLVAVIVLAVVVRKNFFQMKTETRVRLHLNGINGNCPADLPDSALLVVYAASRMVSEIPFKSCSAILPFSSGNKSYTVSLKDAGNYTVNDGSIPQPSDREGDWNVFIDKLAPPDADRRLRISLFRSTADCPEPALPEAILTSKLGQLKSLVIDDLKSDYLSKVFVVTAGVTDGQIQSGEMMHQYWIDTSSLEVLSGTCLDSHDKRMVSTIVYIGNRDNTDLEQFLVKLPLTEEEFGNIKDAYSALLIYALAQDMKRRGIPGQVILPVLAEANMKIQELKGPINSPLKEAIEAELALYAPASEHTR